MKEITDKEKKEVKEILRTVFEKDQKYRKHSRKLLDKYGTNSEEMIEILKATSKLDRENLRDIKEILNRYGWLGEDVIGYRDSETIFLVIQHADLNTQKKYYPVMREAVKKGQARLCDLAMLEDRILVKQGQKQIYGTQLIYNDEEKHYVVEPVENPSEVDIRRKKVGLCPISESLEYYGLSWEEEKNNRKI